MYILTNPSLPIQLVQCTKVDAAIPDLPDDIMEEILSMAGLDTTIMAARGNISASKNVMRQILEKCVIVIDLHNDISGIEGRLKNGELYLHIRNFTRLMSLFENFGESTRRIHINYQHIMGVNYRERRVINENIIKKYANQLTELRINAFCNLLWDEISNDEGNIYFPNVKTFSYSGVNDLASFDLHSIFPKLESFSMTGLIRIADKNCLANVKNLKELELRIDSMGIEEHQLDTIFTNNKGLTRVVLSIANRKDTLRSIERNLKNLTSFEIQRNVDTEILDRAHDQLYVLKSITTFKIGFYVTSQLTDRVLSFDMPNLKILYLNALLIDDRIIDFINLFKRLETVDVRSDTRNAMVKDIGKLIYVKEFIMINSDILEMSLQEMFRTFDRSESSVHTLKVFEVDEAKYNICQDQMNALNGILKEFNKPTWTLSWKLQTDINKNYLLFERDP